MARIGKNSVFFILVFVVATSVGLLSCGTEEDLLRCGEGTTLKDGKCVPLSQAGETTASQSTTTQAGTSGTGSTGTTGTSTGQTTSSGQKGEATGTLTIGGSATAEGLKVTITGMSDPFVSSNMFSKPDSGNRFVAYKLLLENVGNQEISASLLSCQITDSAGFQQDDDLQVIFDEQSLIEAPKLTPGGKYEGWVGFQDKEGNTVTELACQQFLGKEWLRFKAA